MIKNISKNTCDKTNSLFKTDNDIFDFVKKLWGEDRADVIKYLFDNGFLFDDLKAIDESVDELYREALKIANKDPQEKIDDENSDILFSFFDSLWIDSKDMTKSYKCFYLVMQGSASFYYGAVLFDIKNS